MRTDAPKLLAHDEAGHREHQKWATGYPDAVDVEVSSRGTRMAAEPGLMSSASMLPHQHQSLQNGAGRPQ